MNRNQVTNDKNCYAEAQKYKIKEKSTTLEDGGFFEFTIHCQFLSKFYRQNDFLVFVYFHH